ncbi:MAG: hypothetical protein PHP01_04060 [Phycisphaerae bacterium]|nr:hypothetical protein [Phycisphaerae bacterium]
MADSTTSEIEILDRILWGSLIMMECLACHPDSKDERKKLKRMDAIDWFCANIKNRLEVLRKRGETPELFEPVLCRG